MATATVSSTWQCTDNLGFAYCVDSSNDTPVKTDGTVGNTTFQGAIPAGTIVTNTPTRLVVGGVATSPSTINYSQSSTFTNFATGPLITDSFIEIINSPGSRITHLAYYFGKVYWWKDQSFGFADCTDQYNCSITIVSNTVGTLDNSSAFWNGTTFESGANAFSSGASPYSSVGIIGGIFFRGQDNHIYVYDGYALTRLTRRITPTINLINRKKANSWIQSSQSDFKGGTNIPTPNLSENIVPGQVIVSSFSVTEQSTTTWNSGSNTNFAVGTSSLSLLINNSGTVNDPSYENSTGGGPTYNFSSNWTVITNSAPSLWISRQTLSNGCGCTLNPQSGSFFAHASGQPYGNTVFQVILSNGSTGDSATVLATKSITQTNDCTWTPYTLTDTTDIGKRVRFQIKDPNSGINNYIVTTESYIFGGSISFYGNSSDNNCGHGPGGVGIDNIQNGSSTITTGSFTSQIYNTGFTSATYTIQSTFTVNTSTPSFALLTSSANPSNNWVTTLTSTGTNAIGNQFFQYASTISIGASDMAFTSISTVTVIAESSGTYYSAVKNAPLLAIWGTLGITDFTNGNSTITYFTRSSTSPFYVTNSSPPWILQGKNSTVTASTGTYFQLIASFTITAATETPNLSNITFNWFEGSAADKTYMTYFNDYIWIAVSSGTSTSYNNRILRLDLLNNLWLVDDIASNGFAIENNTLYFGDPIQGRVFKFGGVPTDNGAAINAYWKSKEYAGDDPTVQNEYQRVDFIFDVAATTVTYTITLDQNTSQAITLPLTLAGTGLNTIVKRGFLLGVGKIGTFYNFKIGDNSSNPRWRLLFHNIKYAPLYWKPQTS